MTTNKHNIIFKLVNQIYQLILIFLFLELCKGDSCSIIGCIECNYDSTKLQSICQKCDQGYVLNKDLNLCKYQKCEQNLFLQVQPNNSNSKCVAICEDYYQSNSNSNLCNLLDQCPHNYITDTVYSNNQSLKGIMQFTNEMFLVKYDGFINFVKKETGQIIYKYTLISSIISVQFINGVLISVLNDQSVNIWKIETNEFVQLTKVQQGVVNSSNEIMRLDNDFLYITSVDQQKKLVYFNIFQFLKIFNQQITFSNSNQKILNFSKFVVIQKDNGIKIITIEKSLSSQEFQQSELTTQFICEIPLSSTIINLIYSSQLKQIVIQIQNYEYIFVINQTTQSCLRINTSQQVRKISIYYRQNKSDLLITMLDTSIVIRSFSDLSNQIKQINLQNNILDILIYQLSSKISFFLLLNSKEVQWFKSDSQEDTSNYQLDQKIQIKIDTPSQLIPIYSSVDNSIISFFTTGYDFQYIDIQEMQNINTKYAIQSFRQSYQANKGQTTKLYYDDKQSLVYQCSIDGMLTVWNVISSYRVEYYKEYLFKSDNCRDFVLLNSKIIAVVLKSQISVFDVTNPSQKQSFTLPNQSSIDQYSLACNQEYILIQLGECIKLIDSSQNIVLNKCQSFISSFLKSYILQDKYIYSSGVQFLKQYKVDLVQHDLIEQSIIVNNAQNITYFYVDESMSNKIFFIYFDSNTKKLVILDEIFTKIVSTEIVSVERIVNIKSIKDPDNQYRFFIDYYINIASQSSKFTFHTIKQGESQTTLITQIQSSHGIFQVQYRYNNLGELYYKIHTASTLSYTCLILVLKWNFNTNIYGIEQYAFSRDEGLSFLLLNEKYAQIYGGHVSGLLGLTPIYVNYTKIIYQNDQQDKTEIMQIEQSYQLNRIFIIKKYIIEYDMFLNQKIENIIFDEEGITSIEEIKQFQINNNLRLITCFKSYQLILKSYSQKEINTYKIKTFGIINNYYLHEYQQSIYIYGTKLSKFDLKLQNEQIIISPQSSNKLIKQCIFPESLIICKLGDFSLTFLNSLDFAVIKQFEVNGIEIGFLLTFDPLNSNLFLYKKSILIYTLQGVYLSILQQPTQEIIEFNFYGSKIVVLTVGNVYIYSRQTFAYLANFLSSFAGNIKKSMYIPSLNQVYYFSTETKAGQVFSLSLDLLIELTPIKYTYYPNYQIVNFVNENETQFIVFVDTKGNIASYYYGGPTSDNNLPIDEFSENSPKNFSLEPLSNNIIVYNSYLAIQVNAAQITRGLTHYFDPLKSQFIIKSDIQGNKKYIISDTSSILYEYQNYSLVYSSYFDDKIIGIKQSSDQTIVIIYFSDYFLIYKSSSQNQKYMSNNYTFKVTGYRIYKFISDDIFITHDFQLTHYDFTKNLLTKQIDLPKDQTQKCFLFSKEKSLLILGSSNGTIMIYNFSPQNFSLTLNNKQGITDIFIVKEHFWIVQKDGTLNIYPNNIIESSQPESVLSLVSITKNSNQIEGTPIELNIIQVDEQNSRYFVQFNKQKKMSVIDLQTNTLIQHLSFPNNEYNRLKITDKYVVLYSIAQLNVHYRDNLILAFQIRANNRRDEIQELQILNESIFIISFLKKLEIYYVPNSTNSALLVDSLTTNFPLVISSDYDKSTTLLRIVGYSVTNLFEKKYWLQNFQNQQVACSSVIDGITSIDFLRKLNIIQSASSKKNQLFYINVFDMAPINSIDQTKTQLIIKPQVSQQKSFSINTNTFLLIKKDAYLKNFSFLFSEKGYYNFYQETNQIFIEDAQIIGQKIQGIQINFQNKNLVVINSLTLSDIYDDNLRILESNSSNINEELHFLYFVNCDSVFINNLKITDVHIKQMKNFVYFSKIKKLVVKNLTIQGSSFQIFALFENIQNLTIQNVNIQNNKAIQLNSLNPNQLIIIQGSLQVNISQIIISQNIDYQIIYITNQYKLDNQQIQLENDVINLNDIQSQGNQLSSQNLNPNFNQIVIQGTSISIDSIKYSQNNMNILIKNSNNIMIKNSNFTQNTNLLGGAIQLNDIKAKCELINNIFTKNIAFASGGAIYADNIFELQIDRQTQIFQNAALIGGGIRIVNSNLVLNIDKKVIYDNKAEIYGNNIGTIPVDINIYSTQQVQNNFIFTKNKFNVQNNLNNYYGNLIIDQYQSGSSAIFNINYIDIEGNKVKFSPEKIKQNDYPEVIINEIIQWYIQIESLDVNLIQITGESSVNYNQFDIKSSSFVFDEIFINSNPNTAQNLILKYQISNQLKSGEVKIDISFRPCITGEIYKEFSNTIYNCQECTNGYYSIQNPDPNEQNTKECKKCPTDAQVCDKDQIILKEGYWREPNTDTIEQCDERKNSCNENDKNNIKGCVLGYVGPLCEQCDVTGYVWNKRFSMDASSEQCKECSSAAVQYIVLLASAIGLLIYILIQILFFIKNFSIFQTCYYLRMSNMLPISASQMRNQSSFYVKCLINYLQLQAILVNLQIQYIPGSLFIIPNFFGQPSSQIIINMVCILSRRLLSSIGQGKVQIIVLVIVPLIYLFIILIVFFISERLNFKGFQVKSFYKYTALNFIFIFFQSDSINTLTHFLTCREIGSKSYISDDLLFECNDTSYVSFQNYFVIPLLIFWILIPSVVYFFLRKRSKTLNYCSTIFRFGYYCLEYHPTKYYWEFIRIYFKVAIVILYTLYKNNGMQAHLIILFLVAIYISFLQKMKPFINPNMMRFEELSYLTISSIILIYNFLKIYSSRTLEVIYLLFHSSFIIYIVWIIAYNKLFTKRTFVGKIFVYIVQKLVIQKTFVKLTNKMDVKFKTFVQWKIVRKSLHLITNQKALQRITQLMPNSQELLENHFNQQNENYSPDITQKMKNSKFALSYLSNQQILPQFSLLYSPKNSEFLKLKVKEEQVQSDKILQSQTKQNEYEPDKNFTSDQIEEQSQPEDIGINIQESNFNRNASTSQQMEFRTMFQLSKHRNSEYTSSGFNSQLSPKNYDDCLQSPAQHKEIDKILNSND